MFIYTFTHFSFQLWSMEVIRNRPQQSSVNANNELLTVESGAKDNNLKLSKSMYNIWFLLSDYYEIAKIFMYLATPLIVFFVLNSTFFTTQTSIGFHTLHQLCETQFIRGPQVQIFSDSWAAKLRIKNISQYSYKILFKIIIVKQIDFLYSSLQIWNSFLFINLIFFFVHFFI